VQLGHWIGIVTGAVGRGLFAGLIGTVVMTVVQLVEIKLTGRKPSTAPADAAALLGKEKELGAIAPGYFADIVALEGDPLADISAVTDGVRWVMTGGAVVVDRRDPQ
jgi:N-acetylglucosamine-6-phosphate deacetylase